MKVIAVAVMGMLLTGGVQAAETGSNQETKRLVFYSMARVSAAQQPNDSLPSAKAVCRQIYG